MGGEGTAGRDELVLELERFPLLLGCPSGALQALCASAELRVYHIGEIVLEEGSAASHVYFLLEGALRVFYAADSGQHAMAKLFIGPAVFGEMECLVGIAHLENVDVMQPARVVRVPKRAFLAVLERCPEVTYRLLVDVSARLCVAALNERSLAFYDVERRLAALILSYMRVFGLKRPGGIEIMHPLTQAELADGLAATLKSVHRTLTSWKKRRLVDKPNDHYIVRDLAALEALAGELHVRLDYKLRGEPVAEAVLAHGPELDRGSGNPGKR